MSDNVYLIIFLALVVVAVTVNALLKNKRTQKFFDVAFAVAVTVLAVVMVCVVPASKEKYQPLDKTAMYALTVALVAVAVTLVLLRDGESRFDARALTYGGISVATSYALSYVKLFSLPQGGSVTLASMLPVMLYSYLFGVRRGSIVAVVYGLLQFIQSPQFYQPMQVLVDYPIAFGMLGLAGIFKNTSKRSVAVEFCAGAVLSALMRYVASCISGYFVFNSWKMDGYTSLSWALVYNLYVFVELAIIIACAVPVLSAKSVKKLIRTQFS